ncbi:endonuclease I family protein [Actinoplanes sp. CA-252034]|uniref:endonuclease I family protein n=1 Tax=Actinoplanes sp. CA-252034 TaxID=3239906 RepID=UPI003D96487B
MPENTTQRRTTARAMIVLAGLFALAVPPTAIPARAAAADYYDAAAGLSGARLKDALHDVISTGTTAISYRRVWDALKVTDEDPSNPDNVILLYSGFSRAKARNGGGVGDWNREHVWPQSHGPFTTGTTPGTDLHHLRPEDVRVNSDRGNKDFDTGGWPAAGAPGNRTDADSWEPRDAVKGDVARMVFYMAVRYEGGDTRPDLEVAEGPTHGRTPLLGRLSVLRAWHEKDPVDASERRRNQIIFDRYQHNRNPFIDHPEWVDEVF